MAQFDVYKNPSKTSKKFFPYLVNIQSPYIAELATRMVIPLGHAPFFGNVAMKNLTPEFNFEGEKLLLLTPQISSIPAKQLNAPVGSLIHFREQIINALDFAILSI